MEFVYNSAVSEKLVTSLFELDLGWSPKLVMAMLSKSDISLQSLDEFRYSINESLEDARFIYKVSKARQSAYLA